MHHQAGPGPGPDDFFDAALADFGLDSPSRTGSTVGGRIVKTVADGIHERGERLEGPDGRWPDNAESTIKAKGRNAPNHDTDAMLSLEQIAGEIVVTRHEATMTYGKDDECRRKAHYAEAGQGRRKVVRRFFWATESDVDAAFDGFVEDLVAHVARG